MNSPSYAALTRKPLLIQRIIATIRLLSPHVVEHALHHADRTAISDRWRRRVFPAEGGWRGGTHVASWRTASRERRALIIVILAVLVIPLFLILHAFVTE